MAKYNYWHIISEVSREYGKHTPEVKVGLVITHPYKKDDEGVCMITKSGKIYEGAYVLKYLGRILKDEKNENIFEQLNKWIKEKGYEKIAEKSKPKKLNKKIER